ncbi:peroxisomal membrane anchor protein conserved region-domain-containing protein [Glomus cerebriforme]|uniref:Peroxisomal membrane protein PEX14 n=1 Tax=Glomus cerebriforme TaxID=658196 RepID=A0A397SG82_9GLOM|nr:peroxisomal membrane anchor protein conserved region-domain-containing protein [Glomus cerebriforme]
MSTIRQELVQSAINFLKDPQVQNSPLQKRVAFLESKGLSTNEIEEALRQVKGGSSSVASPVPPPPSNQVVVAQPPSVPRMDWRDFFIAAVLIGGIGYAMVEVAKRYIVPLLKTPTANELERDKQALNDQFTAASETLDVVKSDTQIVKKTIEEQVYRTKESLETLDKMMSDIKQQEIKREADLKILKEEVDAIRELIPKLLEKSKDSQNQSLSELQQELKSLKSLLLNRRPNSTIGSPAAEALVSSSPTSTPTTPPIYNTIIPSVSSPFPASRPSIPPWQMGYHYTIQFCHAEDPWDTGI